MARTRFRPLALAVLPSALLPLLLALVLVLRAQPASAAPEGTQINNVSSDSLQFRWYSNWRSDTENGVYQAYSNYSDAAVTFTFVGVAFSYLAEKKGDRGLCQLTVDDGAISQTIDLYDSSGYSQGLQVIYSSGTLAYGRHNVTLWQIGEDSRFGYYPYLVSSTWLETVPTNPTPPAYYEDNTPNIGAIVGGTIGGLIAAVLLGFLFYLWRRDKAQRRRSEGMPVEKVKKADGKMAIDDDPRESKGSDVTAPYPGYGAGYAGYGYPQDPYAGYPHGAYGAGSPYGSPAGAGAWGGGYQQHQPYLAAAPHSARTDGSTDSSAEGEGKGSFAAPASGSRDARTSYYDSAYHSGEGGTVDSRNYPYHVQGFGNESRSYPVPEI
ncbi:hypothetical protein Rhopal_004867-T1 [Rhodotorula paludigena]|uniref:Uncharacterized protein n=1 Tax=Rhodotorula paludigena TaxID=86838 RepID=A0AAV5GPJ2_9BASI|nr:hypothetical protein Rhopal_004867-T1 [Rhodotorula paludigena]